jgi:hypothetical protein
MVTTSQNQSFKYSTSMPEIKDLKQDSLNFNKGTFEGESLMEHSLKKLKAGRSILIDKDDNIIAGNKTAEIAEKLGLKLRIVESDGSEMIAVKRTDIDIDSKEGREMAIADNATASVNLAWDEDNLQLAAEQYPGFDPEQWGIDLDKNAPTMESMGEVDVGTFDTNQTLSIKLTALQYQAVIERLKQESDDLSEALLSILGFYA